MNFFVKSITIFDLELSFSNIKSVIGEELSFPNIKSEIEETQR